MEIFFLAFFSFKLRETIFLVCWEILHATDPLSQIFQKASRAPSTYWKSSVQNSSKDTVPYWSDST